MKAIKSAVYRLVYNRKKKKLSKEEKALVQIEVYYKGRRKYISTGIYLKKEQWDEINSRVVKHNLAMDINILLRNKIIELQNYEYSLINSGKHFDLDMLDYATSKKENSFIDFLKREIEERSDIKTRTYKNHYTLVNKLIEFDKIKNFADLNYNNVLQFDNWCREKGYNENTIHSFHKRLKIYVNRAIKKDLIKLENNPYSKFSAKKINQNDRKYLTEDELMRIENKQFEIKRLEIIKDLFLFSCYTGIAYSDSSKLTKQNIMDELGEKWIILKREKTNEKAKIMLLPKAIEIIKKYDGYKKDYLLPYPSNQKMNAYLKEIADICGINTKLTTHVARHTFATTITLMNGVSLETLQKMLGHTSIKTTEIYGKIVDKRIKEEMSKLKHKF